MFHLLSALPKIVLHRSKRLGRGAGSGVGAKSGRGTTRHQKARESIPLHFEGGQGRMVKRFPLLRGKGRNKSIPNKYMLSLSDLNQCSEKENVTIKTLISSGLLPKEARYARVKIISTGSLIKKLTVQLPVSAGAKKSIEKSGGTVILS